MAAATAGPAAGTLIVPDGNLAAATRCAPGASCASTTRCGCASGRAVALAARAAVRAVQPLLGLTTPDRVSYCECDIWA